MKKIRKLKKHFLLEPRISSFPHILYIGALFATFKQLKYLERTYERIMA